METKTCIDCGVEKPLTAFHKCFSGRLTGNSEGYSERNPRGTVKNRCKSCYSVRERTRYFLDFVDAMGGKCECCGESDPRFLTLDHRNNDGNVHRKDGIQCQQIYRMARAEGYPRSRYAMLCFNCNCARAHRSSDGTCPHRSPESAEQYVARLRARLVLVGRKFVKKETGPRPWKSKEMMGKKYGADLTVEQVKRIKALKNSGRFQRDVAKEFGMSRQLIGMIWTGKRWADV